MWGSLESLRTWRTWGIRIYGVAVSGLRRGVVHVLVRLLLLEAVWMQMWPWTKRLVLDVPPVDKILDVHNRSNEKMDLCHETECAQLLEHYKHTFCKRSMSEFPFFR